MQFPTRERSRPKLKPRFPRIKRLLAKREQPAPREDWSTIVDEKHSVIITPNNLR